MLKKELNSSKIKILVCCHKPCELPKDDIFLPIQVGAAISDVDLGMQRDDRVNGQPCDNISAKNKSYCELTAMYWAWKNIKKLYPGINYIGLCHYRRFFYVKRNFLIEIAKYLSIVLKILIKLLTGMTNHSYHLFTTEYSCNYSKIFLEKSNSKIKNMCKRYDVITTIPIKIIDSDVRSFFNVIGRTYIDLTERIVKEYFQPYLNSFEKVMAGNKLVSANMFIIKTDLLDEYCSFVFGVLEKHLDLVKEEKICINPEDEKIYSRVSGYLAEFLTYIFIIKKKAEGEKIKYINKVFIQNL